MGKSKTFIYHYTFTTELTTSHQWNVPLIKGWIHLVYQHTRKHNLIKFNSAATWYLNFTTTFEPPNWKIIENKWVISSYKIRFEIPQSKKKLEHINVTWKIPTNVLPQLNKIFQHVYDCVIFISSSFPIRVYLGIHVRKNYQHEVSLILIIHFVR